MCVWNLKGEWGDVETLMEWYKHKNLPPQKDIETPSINNHLGHIWYNVIFHAFYLFFKCPQTHMILTISMFSKCIWLYPRFRWILQDWLNEDVWLSFQSMDCTHGLMWWKYVFIIKQTPKRMVNQHMANKIPSHQLACHNMHPEVHNFGKITFELNWV